MTIASLPADVIAGRAEAAQEALERAVLALSPEGRGSPALVRRVARLAEELTRLMIELRALDPIAHRELAQAQLAAFTRLASRCRKEYCDA